jgi:hypothetical protein
VNINALSSLPFSLLQPRANTATANLNATSAIQQQADAHDISLAAQFLNKLQQIQLQNPDQFKQIASTIADQLQKEAKAALSAGNSTQANQLNQLASEFQTAAQNGQIPSIQALQQAGLSGHHHHHHGSHASGQASQMSPLSALPAQTSGTSTQDILTSIFSSVINGTGATSPTSGTGNPPAGT